MPRTLHLSPRSPFARKVRILLLEKRLPFEIVQIDLTARTPEFSALSPLGKVPLLVDEDGTLVFDSTVIAEYLEDRYPEPPLLGHGVQERLRHRSLDELADTVADQSVTLFFDREPHAHVQKAERLLDKALDEIVRRIERGETPRSFGLGHAALIGALGYHAFRLGRRYLDPRPALETFLAPHLSRPSVVGAPAPVA